MASFVNTFDPRQPFSLCELEPADPAVGNNYAAIEVPAGEVWEIQSLSVKIVCDATVANRTVQVNILSSDNKDVSRYCSTRVMVASETGVQNFQQFATVVGANTLLSISNPIAPSYILPGQKISVELGSKQAGDQFSKLFIVCKKWGV